MTRSVDNHLLNILWDFFFLFVYPQTAVKPVQGICQCTHGYWGPACANECPGGRSNPCYGKGTCDPANGICSCDEGAEIMTQCETCKDGWFGDDCSLTGTNAASKFWITIV